MKKKYIIFLLIFSLISFNFFALKAKADSGWDTSYDGGGSSWNSGGWDSGWSRNDSNWSSSSYSGGVEASPSAILITFIIIFIIVVIALRSGKVNISNGYTSNNYVDLPDDVLSKFGINKATFKDMVYSKYVKIQQSWTNFDYDELRDNLTDELYNTYMMQLDALKLKNQKNIMSDFKYIDSKIISVKEENGLLNVNVYLRVEMYDYVVDEKNTVLRGKSNRKIDVEYVITFVKTTGSEIKDVFCPNCGAKIDVVSSGKCNYCGSTVVVDAKDYVMSKKTCVGQRSK